MRSKNLPLGLTAILLAAIAAPAAAQAPELVTDRPDQTESAAVVPAGAVQVETGASLERHPDGAESVALGSTLVRVGLAPRLELRLGWDGWIDERFAGGAGGAGDGEVGLKVRLWDEGGGRPEAALLAGVGVPVGERRLTSDRYDPALRLSFAHTLTEELGLGYNLGMRWASEPGAAGAVETFSAFEYTAALGFALTPRLGAFAELFGEVPVDGPGGAAHSADGGLTWLLADRLQLDLAGGVGLSDAAPDWFVGAGVSVRWPG